jgi:amino acid adenylation domain-containing protein
MTTATLLHDLLDNRAATTPDAIGLTRCDFGSWSYAELGDRSRAAARWLGGLGVRRGDRVVIIGRNDAEIVPLIFGISRLGALFVLLSYQIPERHLTHILSDSAPVLVVVSRAAAHMASRLADVSVRHLDDLPGPADPGGPSSDPPGKRALTAGPCLSIDPVSLIYTSGSTALPKAVVSTHRQVIFAAEAIQSRLRYRGDDSVFCCLPLSFDYGLYQVFLTCAAGARLVLGDDSDAGPPLPGRLVAEGISVLPLVPSIGATFCRLVKRGASAPRLRMITNTGAELTAAACAQLRSAVPGVAVVAMFGLTECKRISIAEPNLDLTRPGSVGRPLPDTEIAVIGDDGQPLAPGQVGELIVRGPHVMAGYWRAPELTATRFRPDALGQPVLYTGDLCRIDEDGYLYFVGRNDDLYKQHGFRVSATEIEAAAMDIPGVELAAALPPNHLHGSRLIVMGALAERQLVKELRARLEPEKFPAECRVVSAMPLSVNKKIDKRTLDKNWAEMASGTSAIEASSAVGAQR